MGKGGVGGKKKLVAGEKKDSAANCRKPGGFVRCQHWGTGGRRWGGNPPFQKGEDVRVLTENNKLNSWDTKRGWDRTGVAEGKRKGAT